MTLHDEITNVIKNCVMVNIFFVVLFFSPPKGIDVNTCSLDDLQFSASFSLECHREGQMTAVIGYFDIGFESECSQKVKLFLTFIPYSLE